MNQGYELLGSYPALDRAREAAKSRLPVSEYIPQQAIGSVAAQNAALDAEESARRTRTVAVVVAVVVVAGAVALLYQLAK